MELADVELFGTLMRTGTATETALVLGISQPGVSARLKRLESRLGLLLFHRSGRRLVPTAEAEALFAEASTVFEGQRRLGARVVALRHDAIRPIGISATPAIVDGFLAPTLAAAGHRRWPQELSIRVTEPEDDLRNGCADLGLQMAFPASVEFHAERLLSVPLRVVMQREHPMASASGLTIAALSDEPLVCYDPDWSPMGSAIRKAWRRAGCSYAPRCVVPFCSTVCQLVRACGGIGFVDVFTAAGPWPELVFRRVDGLPDVALVMFHERRRPLRTPVQRIAEALRRAAERGQIPA